MADISQELSQIKNSVYGKTMRTAIHNAIKKVNEDGGGGDFTIKKITYTGNGNLANQITFPSTPKMIIKITGSGSSAPIIETDNIIYNQDTEYYTRYLENNTSTMWQAEKGTITYSGNTMTLVTTTQAASGALNTNNQEYTVFYI